MNPHLVYVTTKDDAEAKMIARTVIEERLAACANLLGGMQSIYQWKGELRAGTEHKIFVKTSADRLEPLRQEIRSAHPYAVAEILYFEIDSGDPEYLDWITQSTQ